ncbi:MAG: hypothetical protein AAGD32_08565 [Planctomycetota bacterium]
MLLTLVGVVGWAVWRYHEPVGQWFAWQRAMRACMAFEMPEDEHAASPMPDALQRLSELDGRLEWVRPITRNKTQFANDIIFLGTLQRPDGQRRLMIVGGRSVNGYNPLTQLRVLALPEPSLSGSERQEWWSIGRMYSGIYIPARFRLASVDHEDPTSLLLPLDVHAGLRMNGEGEVTRVEEPDGGVLIRMSLQDDDTVTFEIVPNTQWGRGPEELQRPTRRAAPTVDWRQRREAERKRHALY